MSIGFSGNASGKGLRLFRFDVGCYEYVGIGTAESESYREVTSRFDQLLKMLDNWRKRLPSPSGERQDGLLLADDILRYWVGGEEQGLGIPHTPRSLTCNYDPKNRWYTFAWEDPNQDVLFPVAFHAERPIHPYTKQGANWMREFSAIPQNMDARMREALEEQIAEKYRDAPKTALDSPAIVLSEHLQQGTNLLTLILWSLYPQSTSSDYWIDRLRCPSAPGVLLFGPGYQSSFLDLPLGKKVIPNWMSWGGDSVELAVVARDGIEDNLYSCSGKGTIDVTKQPQTYYQRFRNVEGARGGGIWRDYLGLTPNHTYRVRIRLNTLDVQPASAGSEPDKNEAWTFSIHATPGVAGKNEDPTYEQFMGVSSWADEKPDPLIGQIACYGPETTTGGEWVERVSGDGGPGSTLGVITLPEGCDRITVWLRCTGPIPKGVGMDWIQFEDRTIIEQLEKNKTQ
jgi:hypothetical protein